MEIRTKLLVTLYLVTALFALLLTWYHIPSYLGEGLVEANKLFWRDALFETSSAGKFLVVDILFLAFACNIYMFIEGRRLGVKFLYLYILAGVLIAISVAFPLFMAAREIYASKTEATMNKVKPFDVVVLVILFLAAVGSGVVLL